MNQELEAARLAAMNSVKAAREAANAAELATKRFELTERKFKSQEELEAIQAQLDGLPPVHGIKVVVERTMPFDPRLSRHEDFSYLDGVIQPFRIDVPIDVNEINMDGLPMNEASERIRTLAYSDGLFSTSEISPNMQRLALPRLLPDHSDVDQSCRDHLDPQVEQILAAFKDLTTPEKPYLPSRILKKYLEGKYVIPFPDYWKAKTHPREPERWWKNIYDKAIERMDLTLHLIVRRDVTGKKGVYALKEHLNQAHDEFIQALRNLNP